VFLVTGRGSSHRRRGRREEDDPDPLVLPPSSAAARESTRRQWRWRVEQCAAIVPSVREASQKRSQQFQDFF